MTITLYDFPGKRPEHDAWNPNVLKTRYSLAYKNLPYETVLLEYPDIEATMKRLGAAPTCTKLSDDSPIYTLPVIHDSATNAVISDSFAIAHYLDEKYPYPPLFPNGTHAFHAAFNNLFMSQVMGAMAPFYLPSIASNVLNPRSEEFFRRTRVEFGIDLEGMSFKTAAEEEKAWKIFEESLGSLHTIMGRNDIYVMGGGDSPCFADFIIASWLRSFRIVVGEHSSQWRDIKGWHNGRWNRFFEALEKYESRLVQGSQERWARL